MKNFYSLSQYPGKNGEKYFNTLFNKFNVDAFYTALACENIQEGVQRVKDLGGAGFSVSMPFKQSIIDLLDFGENLVFHFNSCNTVEIKDGKLHGYNTDRAGAVHVINLLPTNSKISILGDGAMGSMFKKLLGSRAITYSRNLGNWDLRYRTDSEHYNQISNVIINCTSFGTAVFDSPFEVLPHTDLVIDLAIKPNQLEQQCITAGVKYIGGMEFYKYQFIRQFGIYTKRVITIEDVNSV